MSCRIVELASRGDWAALLASCPDREQVALFMETAPEDGRIEAAKWLISNNPSLQELEAIIKHCSGNASGESAENEILSRELDSDERRSLLSSGVLSGSCAEDQLLGMCDEEDLIWLLSNSPKDVQTGAYYQLTGTLEPSSPRVREIYDRLPQNFKQKMIEDVIIGKVGSLEPDDLLTLADLFPECSDVLVAALFEREGYQPSVGELRRMIRLKGMEDDPELLTRVKCLLADKVIEVVAEVDELGKVVSALQEQFGRLRGLIG